MKKLNRKGFTLVELLAVIIILAIVVGISIPAITNIINDSKNNALEVALNSAEKFVSDQYAYMQIDNANANSAFKTAFASGTVSGTTKTLTVDAALIKAMGLTTDNVSTLTVTLDTNTGKACVTATKIPTNSQYYTTAYWTAAADGSATPTASSGVKNKSKSCS